MVNSPGNHRSNAKHLSVLALSSRFDGRVGAEARCESVEPFSTRSVESF